jgi:nickel transport protein
VHEGDGTLPYPRENVIRIDCFDTEGRRQEVSLSEGSPVMIDEVPAATCVVFSSGYWSETPFGTKNLPKTEAKAPKRSWLSVETVKRIDIWNRSLSAPLTGDLEIVPLENPLVLEEGDKARLMVTLDRRPLAGVTVSYDGRERGATDEEGRINIKLRHPGLQFIQAGQSTPVDSLKCDEVVRTATFVFEVGGGHLNFLTDD